MATKVDVAARIATLRMVSSAEGPVLRASMPPDSGRADYGKVTQQAFDVISKLTGHPCLSGRFRFEFDDVLINRAMSVDLVADKLITG